MLTVHEQLLVYAHYCPRHEYEWWECCACCSALKVEMWRMDNRLRVYWHRQGYRFTTPRRRKAA